ncbi:hypothetical protein GWK47_047937 [Chionoecetes opilio]|uniref:Uncharacterized protein n=1 Tax=Chionoecetes opilio TaxID=41210 RepID=A0A8J4YG34_CHIOP|nr:hypothetical protein GWK47_047937 [Chionoecetes opilio]
MLQATKHRRTGERGVVDDGDGTRTSFLPWRRNYTLPQIGLCSLFPQSVAARPIMTCAGCRPLRWTAHTDLGPHHRIHLLNRCPRRPADAPRAQAPCGATGAGRRAGVTASRRCLFDWLHRNSRHGDGSCDYGAGAVDLYNRPLPTDAALSAKGVGPRRQHHGMCFDHNSVYSSASDTGLKDRAACVNINEKARQTESRLHFSLPGTTVLSKASGGRSIHRLLTAHLPARDPSCFKRFVKIIRHLHTRVLKGEAAARTPGTTAREAAAHLIVERVGDGRPTTVLDGWQRDLHSKITLFREEWELRSPSPREKEGAELIRFQRRSSIHNVRWNRGHVRPPARPRPRATDLALLKALALLSLTRRSGGHRAKGDGPEHVVRLRGARRPLPLRRGDGGQGEAGHRQRHAAAAGGEEPASPRRRPLDAVEQRSLASFATTNSVGLVTALGPVTISSTSIRPSGRGGTTTPRLVGAPVTYGATSCGGAGGVTSRAVAEGATSSSTPSASTNGHSSGGVRIAGGTIASKGGVLLNPALWWAIYADPEDSLCVDRSSGGVRRQGGTGGSTHDKTLMPPGGLSTLVPIAYWHFLTIPSGMDQEALDSFMQHQSDRNDPPTQRPDRNSPRHVWILISAKYHPPHMCPKILP